MSQSRILVVGSAGGVGLRREETSMSRVDRFLEYAEAFDRAVETGDWSEVRRFFTEDAVFESLANPPMDGVAHGHRRALRDDRRDAR